MPVLMAVWIALRTWWRARQRKLDLEVLWPQLRDNAGTPIHAKVAFAAHVLTEPAWLELGEEEIARVIDGLAP
jgi:hypothetical protein